MIADDEQGDDDEVNPDAVDGVLDEEWKDDEDEEEDLSEEEETY
ncbi:MAG TPA: hypothetical protein VNM40_03500 [Candidatus Paceibacterota bacterium]|nr:hypothetical protein [Candidatus Paceibacterota bacterium]